MHITSRSSDDKTWIVCDMPDDGSPRYFLYSRADKSTVLICIYVCMRVRVCLCVCIYDELITDLRDTSPIRAQINPRFSYACVYVCVCVCTYTIYDVFIIDLSLSLSLSLSRVCV